MTGIPRQVPDQSGSRDFQTILRAIKYRGALESDPERPGEGWTWIRADLDPVEIRAFVGGTLYKVELTAV